MQITAAATAIRCIQQLRVKPVRHAGAVLAAFDFQPGVMHRTELDRLYLMHDPMIAAAQAFPAAGVVQCFGGEEANRALF